VYPSQPAEERITLAQLQTQVDAAPPLSSRTPVPSLLGQPHTGSEETAGGSRAPLQALTLDKVQGWLTQKTCGPVKRCQLVPYCKLMGISTGGEHAKKKLIMGMVAWMERNGYTIGSGKQFPPAT